MEQTAMTKADDFGAPPVQRQTGMMDVATTRAAQEVQAAMVIAKRFPRDQHASFHAIMQACKRQVLAESSMYAYPRGNTTVRGPSIRLAEVLAQSWGNIDFGIIELEQNTMDGESHVMAYAWDLESNARQTKVFTVPHVRHTRERVYRLDDPRDIYELVANQGARRLRACILGIIPGDIVDAAMQACEETMRGDGKVPLVDRVRAMVEKFGEYGVTQQMIERRLGHKLAATTEDELVTLRNIFVSLRDGMADRGQYFQLEDAERMRQAPDGEGNDLTSRMRRNVATLKNGADEREAKPTSDDDDEPKQAPKKKRSKRSSKKSKLFDADADPPADSALIESLVKQLANKAGCTLDEARLGLRSFCTKIEGVEFGKLTDDQCADVARLIADGTISVP